MTTMDSAKRAAGQTWAVVLAAGEGNRLRTLTTDSSGVAVPKQFCSLRDGPSLLHEALQRAETIADRERICVVVAQQHTCWWNRSLEALPPANVIVQPQNRGTAIGILLALLHILERDSRARVVLLPSDHYVGDEEVMCAALERSVGAVRNRQSEIVLLGIAPEGADTELGYIVPAGERAGELSDVVRFVEKPAASEARALIGRGALWNVFIIAAQAPSLLNLFDQHDPILVQQMRAAVKHDIRPSKRPSATADLYLSLPYVDFSRHIAQGREAALTVLRVPSCGWTDLGTLERVGQTLRAPAPRPAQRHSIFHATGHLSLEMQHAANSMRRTMEERSEQIAQQL